MDDEHVPSTPASHQFNSTATLGAVELDPADSVLARFPTLESHLTAVAAVDDALAGEGYLGTLGRARMRQAATELRSRATGSAH